MRLRPIVAMAAVAAAVVALPASASKPVLDGRAHKVLTFKDTTTGPQDHDSDLVTGNTLPACPSSRCAHFYFLYRPAKHVKKGPFSVRISWTIPGQDYDLWVTDNRGDAGSCGAAAGTSEVVVVNHPVAGHTYGIVIDHYRSLPDTITAAASFPAKDKVVAVAPAAVESNVAPVNCGIS